MMKQDEFERLFEQAFSQAVRENITVPDATASWHKIERKLRRRQQRRRFMLVLPYAVASFLVGALLFGSPVVSKAVSPLYQSVQYIQRSMSGLIFGTVQQHDSNIEAKTPPPPESPLSTYDSMQIAHASQDVHYASWDEAARHTVFAHLSVDNSITGFTLTETMLFYDDQSDKATKAVLLFTNEQDERYRISIRVIGEREVTATSLFGSASKSEKIRLANGDGWLTVMEDGRTMLDYVSESFHISISGQLDESEIVEVANAIHS